MAASSFWDDSEDFETEDPTPPSPPHKRIKIEPVDPDYEKPFVPPPPDPLDYKAKIDEKGYEKGYTPQFTTRIKTKVQRLLDFYSPMDVAELDSLINAAETFLHIQQRAKISPDEVEDFFPLNSLLWKTLEEEARNPVTNKVEDLLFFTMRMNAEQELKQYLDNPARLKSNTTQLFGFENFFDVVYNLYKACCSALTMRSPIATPRASEVANILHSELINAPTSKKLKQYFINLEKCAKGEINAGRNLLLPASFEYSFYAYLQIQLDLLRQRNPNVPKLFILEMKNYIDLPTFSKFLSLPSLTEIENCLRSKINMIFSIGAMTEYVAYFSEKEKDTPAIANSKSNAHAMMFTVRYEDSGKPYITIHDPGNWVWLIPDRIYKSPEQVQKFKLERFEQLIARISDGLSRHKKNVTPYWVLDWFHKHGLDENSIINFNTSNNKDFPSYQANQIYLSNTNCITISLWDIWWCCANIEKYFIQKQNLIEGFDFNNFPALHLFICYSSLNGKVPLTKEDLSNMYTAIKDFEDEGKHPRSIKTLVGSGQIPPAQMREILAFVREVANLKLKKTQNNLSKPPEDYNNPTKNSEFRSPVYNSVFNTLW